MNRHFSYVGGILHAESVPLPAIATAVDTPVYVYSTAAIAENYTRFAGAVADLPSLVCYAMKANSNQAVLTLLAGLGAGMDVVSEGELRRARAAGVPGERIVFSGVAKSAREMAYAIGEDILCFNVESVPELDLLSQVAQSMGRTARVSLRINPDVDAKTHAKIATGKAENKFGIPWHDAREVYRRAAALPRLAVTGIDAHIGSQITELAPFEAAFARLAELVSVLRSDGHAIHHLDLGGGLGIAYREDSEVPEATAYAAVVHRHAHALDCRILFEPGRLLVGNAGILLTRVVYLKHGAAKSFVIVDAGMNDLIRPTLYEAHHEIRTVAEAAVGAERTIVDVVGPVCESGDFLAQARPLPPVTGGDLIAILSAGAYGAVQAGTYNSRLLVPEVMVSGDRFEVVRPRSSYEALIGLDQVPSWIAGA
ncbi:diaminopimelate decarboxylase [Segnochrobactrum spirostomi]|uniref:Diaminopimelate decarboxylase n=1 Tax=Segnochrobactrum spirostomi TaxID=2608987 RepID=A0A6A7Y6P4_9HYPH|nr:diaminopimelate decarboxylase [Segnochrobactrum spirostomi]MQT13332.1 diaminopimelate decarboxylase [Segnochrobactrum spirostomi]